MVRLKMGCGGPKNLDEDDMGKYSCNRLILGERGVQIGIGSTLAGPMLQWSGRGSGDGSGRGGSSGRCYFDSLPSTVCQVVAAPFFKISALVLAWSSGISQNMIDELICSSTFEHSRMSLTYG